MAPIQPGSAAEKALSIEALRADKHRIINALEEQKLNPVYAHVASDIEGAQRTLETLSVETQGTKVHSIVKEAQRRQLVEQYEDPNSVQINWWMIALCLMAMAVLVKKNVCIV